MIDKAHPLFTTEPHGQQRVKLLEDASKPEDRIYEVCDVYESGAVVRMLGSEIASLCEWWANEKTRAGEDVEDD